MQWWSAQVPDELLSLVFAFALSAVIGLERQRRSKSAGLRTHTLVALGAATFTVISAHGFASVVGSEVVLDPSRIAAQIVSGIGFLGAGVIFVRRSSVSGLTTAASIWVSAAIGMACGAGLPTIAAATTLIYVLGVSCLPVLARLVSIDRERVIVAEYHEGHGALREMLAILTEAGIAATFDGASERSRAGKSPRIQARIRVTAVAGAIEPIAARLSEVRGVATVRLMSEE